MLEECCKTQFYSTSFIVLLSKKGKCLKRFYYTTCDEMRIDRRACSLALLASSALNARAGLLPRSGSSSGSGLVRAKAHHFAFTKRDGSSSSSNSIAPALPAKQDSACLPSVILVS